MTLKKGSRLRKRRRQRKSGKGIPPERRRKGDCLPGVEVGDNPRREGSTEDAGQRSDLLKQEEWGN